MVRRGDFDEIRAAIRENGGSDGQVAVNLLSAAATAGNVATLDKLLAEGVPINGCMTSGPGAGETALMSAVGAERAQAVDFLLRRGANPNFVGRSTSSLGERTHAALFGVAWNGSVDIARLLLAAGADPNIGGSFAVRLANEQADLELFELLTQRGGRLPPMPSTTRPPGLPNSPTASVRQLGLAELLPAAAATAVPRRERSRPRLAVIADDANADAADLLVAQLSGDRGIELVERQELDRLLAEQKLARNFVADAANLRSVAPLVRADALLLVRTRDLGEIKAVEARFVRVNPGIVLDTVYRAAPLTDAPAWAVEMRARVLALAARARQTDTVAISLRDVHATLPSDAARRLERILTVLLRDRLVHDPRFVVLERAELAKVTFETGTDGFWSGKFLVDPVLDVALDNSDRFELTLHFQPSARGQPVLLKAAGLRTQPGAVLDTLFQQLPESFGRGVASRPRDLHAEARGYMVEGRWAMAAGLPERAEAAAEAAWALGARSLEVAQLRLQSASAAINDLGREPVVPGSSTATESLELAQRMVHGWSDFLDSEVLRKDPTLTRQWLTQIEAVTEGVMMAFVAVPTAADQISQAARLQALREAYWDAQREASARAGQVPDSAALEDMLVRLRAKTARLILRDRTELVRTLRDVFGRRFATQDGLNRARLRVDFSWGTAAVLFHMSRQASSGRSLCLPRDETARRQVMDVLRQSTAPDDHLLATLIRLEPRTAGRLSDADRSALLQSFWEMRDVLAADRDAATVYLDRFARMATEFTPPGERVRTYRVAFDEGKSGQPDDVTQVEFCRRLYLYLCEHANVAGADFRRLLTPSRYTPGQLEEVRRADQAYAARTGGRLTPFPPDRPRVIQRAPAAPGANRGAGELAKGAATTPAQHGRGALRVRRMWLCPDPAIRGDFVLQPGSLQWTEGQLWFHGYALSAGADRRKAAHYLFALDCATGRADKFELPPSTPPRGVAPEAMFVVAPEDIVVAADRDFLGVYDRAARTWAVYPDIKPARLAAPLVEGDGVYLIVQNGAALVRFDLTQRRSELLASTQRKPAQSPLDLPGTVLVQAWRSDNGEIITASELNPDNPPLSDVRLAGWSPAQRTWRVVQAAQPKAKTRLPVPVQPGITDGGRVIGRNAFIHTLGNARDANGDGLRWRLEQDGVRRELPVEFILPQGMEPARDGFGYQSVLNLGPGWACPAGYVFPLLSGPGFWFLPKEELDAYLAPSANPTARQVSSR